MATKYSPIPLNDGVYRSDPNDEFGSHLTPVGRKGAEVPLAQQPPYPKSAPSQPRVDPRFAQKSQLMPGVEGAPEVAGVQAPRRAAGLAVVDALNSWAEQRRYGNSYSLYQDFINAGGRKAAEFEDGKLKKLTDFYGNTGIKLKDGHEYWRAKIVGDDTPSGVNVEVKTIKGADGRDLRLYKYHGGDWSAQPPEFLSNANGYKLFFQGRTKRP